MSTSGMFRGRYLSVPIVLLMLLSISAAEPIEPGAIEVIDGDTIRANGRTVRLVRFDAPEAGFHARCGNERTLAAKATFRLRQLVSAGGLDLRLVPCVHAGQVQSERHIARSRLWRTQSRRQGCW